MLAQRIEVGVALDPGSVGTLRPTSTLEVVDRFLDLAGIRVHTSYVVGNVGIVGLEQQGSTGPIERLLRIRQLETAWSSCP